MAVLLVLMLVVCGIFWCIYRDSRNSRREEEQKWRKEAILVEAEGVIMDFLEYGREVSQATKGSYRGIISVRMQPVYKNGEMGFFISMYDSGDLKLLDDAMLTGLHLEGFVTKYGHYYDPERDAVVYRSHSGVRLKAGEKDVLTQTLLQRIQNHPMAEVKSEAVIGTRGI